MSAGAGLEDGAATIVKPVVESSEAVATHEDAEGHEGRAEKYDNHLSSYDSYRFRSIVEDAVERLDLLGLVTVVIFHVRSLTPLTCGR